MNIFTETPPIKSAEYNRVLLSHKKKKKNRAICNNMDDSRGLYTK